MAVAKNTVSALGGDMSLRTGLHQGTTFTLRLPLTLSVADALIIGVGGQKFALPQNALQEVTQVSAQNIKRLENGEFMQYREGVLPVIRLGNLFDLGAESRADFPVIVISNRVGRIGVVVDRIFGQREIVVRPLSDPMFKIPAISGATELGDGRAVLILDAIGLVQTARQRKIPAMNGH